MFKIAILAMAAIVSGNTQYLPAVGTNPANVETLTWHNIARTDPARLVPILENMKQYFNGKLYSAPGKIPLIT